MENEECGGMRRAEIDTSVPFRSVKEAVMIFGERVLAGEVYANKLNQIRAAEMNEEEHTIHSSSAELEETKQNLERAREESQVMATCLTSLKEELEKTKLELTELKAKEPNKQSVASETEDIKFIESAREVEVIIESPMSSRETEFQKKRTVKFANPPIQMISSEESRVLDRQYSVERVSSKKFSIDKEALPPPPTPTTKKKKKWMPMIAAVFSKKKAVSYA